MEHGRKDKYDGCEQTMTKTNYCNICGEMVETTELTFSGKYFICKKCLKTKPKKDLKIGFELECGEGTYHPERTYIEVGFVDYGSRLFVVLHHEIIHHILHKITDTLTCGQWDNVSPNGEISKELLVVDKV